MRTTMIELLANKLARGGRVELAAPLADLVLTLRVDGVQELDVAVTWREPQAVDVLEAMLVSEASVFNDANAAWTYVRPRHTGLPYGSRIVRQDSPPDSPMATGLVVALVRLETGPFDQDQLDGISELVQELADRFGLGELRIIQSCGD